ncbi:MAG: septum formation protein Maf [Betaproteobacteria bacterium RIFCSPLOWO2_02_64_14]|nr:MAG: septum formation protein Maf [Betaproteobacteria bacterium RIFCSPLOWO2_02_64_14]
MASKRIYLASRSPRRRELLKQIGVSFELVLLREDPRRGPDVDETPLPDEAADAYALRIARSKAVVAVQQLARRGLPLHPVLAADTTVVCDGVIIGKPADAEDAARILARLAGREHRVMTAVALAHRDEVAARLSDSAVEFRTLAADEIRRYVASGEPLDKAGAYAVQGRAAAFVTRISGSYSGIMGLPLADAAELLQRCGIEVL